MTRVAELVSRCTDALQPTTQRHRARLLMAIAIGAGLMCRPSAASAQTVDTFDPGTNGAVFAIATQPDGKVLIGGAFSTIGGGGTGSVSRPSIARVDATGAVDDFNAGTDSRVFAIALQPDGKVVLGGDFSMLGCCVLAENLARSRIARVNDLGKWDQAFNPGANGNVYAVVVQPDGKIIVGGDFTMLGGGGTGTTPRNHIGRLNADGSIDSSFDPGADGSVFALALQPDGKILVGGVFTTLGGGGTGTTARGNVGRLMATGALDTGFVAGTNGEVGAFALQKDGKILIGGDFTQVNDTARSKIARLNDDGSLDAFDPGANNVVASIGVQTDGKILVGGHFTTLGGGGVGTTTRNRIGRLNADGTIDGSFNPGANDLVFAVALQPDGTVIVGGQFTGLGGGTGTTPRSNIGRVTNTIPAVQTVSVDAAGSVLTWTRTGSAPELSKATFEVSNDGTTYTILGNATRVADGWELTGQSLAVNQNLSVRARGYYATGYLSGSGSIAETLKAVFIPAPPTVSTSAATGIGVTAATLNGTANPNGLITTGSFEYGLTAGYGSTTAGQVLGAGGAAVAIGGGAITGLTCNTLYHFRATASNASGTATGVDARFTTLACPATVVTAAATNVTESAATLHGSVNPNGSATTALFEYGPTLAYGSQVAASPAPGSGSSPVDVNATISGLNCNTQFHFRVVGTNASSVNGSDMTFTTGACPTPTVLSISPAFGLASGGTAVTIVGTDFRAGATVKLGGIFATNVVVVNSTTITATTAAHPAELVSVVVTNSGALVGTLSNAYSYSTGLAPTITSIAPPTGSIGGGVTATITGTNFLVGATVSFGGVAATVTLTSATSLNATTPAHAAGAVDVVITNPDTETATLAGGFTYTGSTGGGGGGGGSSNSSTPAPAADPTPAPPPTLQAPVNLVSNVSGSTVTLSWTAAASGAVATNYIVEAGSFSGGTNLAVMSTNSVATTLVVPGVSVGTYFVRVRAANNTGTSAPSNEVIVAVGSDVPSQTGMPGTPGILTVTASGTTVSLVWNPPSAGGAATAYMIEAGSAPGLSDLARFSTGTPATSLSVGNVGSGTYYVRVRAQNAAGTGAPSNEVTLLVGASICTSPAGAPSGLSATVAGSTVSLNWSPSSGAPSSYVIVAGSSSGGSDLATIDTGSPATTLTATAGSGTYYVRVLGKNACGISAPSNEVVVQVP